MANPTYHPMFLYRSVPEFGSAAIKVMPIQHNGNSPIPAGAHGSLSLLGMTKAEISCIMSGNSFVRYNNGQRSTMC